MFHLPLPEHLHQLLVRDVPIFQTMQKNPPAQRARIQPHGDNLNAPQSAMVCAGQFKQSEHLKYCMNTLSSPFLIFPIVYITVESEAFNSFFSKIWYGLIRTMYPDSRYDAAGIITEEQFQLVCRYFLKARIDHVYSTHSGRRPEHRIAMPRQFMLPKCVSDIINSVGYVAINGGAYRCVPQPELAAVDQARRLHVRVTHAMLSGYSHLISNAISRNLVKEGFLSSETNGTAWWLLSPRTTQDITANAVNQDECQVIGVFKEWTPADACYAAMVQRGFNGHVASLSDRLWSTDYITGISSMTYSFLTSA